MRISIFLVLIISLMLVSCAGPEKSPDDLSDVTEAPAQTNDLPAAGNPSSETSEQDLLSNNAPTGQNPPEAAPPPAPEPDQTMAEQPPNPPANGPENVPPPEAAMPPPAEVDNSQPTGKAVITALDFKSDLNGGTVVVRTNKPVRFSTRKNEKTNQFIIELENTTVPKKFQRPYTTKEFPGAIASINAYQSKGGSRVARIVIQLRESIEPEVVQNGNVISVAGQGGPGAQQQAEAESPSAPTEENAESQEGPSKPSADLRNLNEKSLDGFLNGNVTFHGRPMSIEVTNQDVREVLKFISEEAGVNIVVGDDVKGNVTLKLRKIPWDQILSVVLASKQLGYVKQGNVLRVATLERLHDETESAKKVIESRKDLAPIHIRIFPLSYSVATDLEAQVKTFLSKRGKISSDKRTNSLVVKDIDEVLNSIKGVVNRLDVQTPQVLIEAKVVEARDTYQRIIGVNWGMTGQAQNIGQNSTGGAVNLTPHFSSTIPTSGTISSFGLNVGTMDIIGDLTSTLNLLEIENLVKVISSPRIVTLDRVEAKIDQSTQFPVFKTTVGANGVPIADVSFQTVKLELTVKPQITVEGGIILDVNVLREFPDPVIQVGLSQARPINSRNAKTQVLAENGDTVVIGGIYQSDVAVNETGIPWLRKIPLIGWLFKAENRNREKNELVIFLTPRVLNREKAFVKGDEAPQ